MPVVFVLGCTGLIGNEVALQFIRKGYEVYGLARTEEKANQLKRVEIKPVIASGKDVEIWSAIATKADIIVEAIADYSDYEVEHVVYQEIHRIAKSNPNITIIYTNGIWQYGSSNDLITEHSTLSNAPALVKNRIALGSKYIALGAILILPSLVYGGSGAHSAHYFRSIEKGEITLFSEDQYQTYIHYIDIASMYVAAAERAHLLRGESFIAADHVHKVSDVVKGIAAALGKEIKITYKGAPTDDYQACLALNQRASNSKAKIKLDWKPTQRSLIDDAQNYCIKIPKLKITLGFDQWPIENAFSVKNIMSFIFVFCAEFVFA
ncbi:hypothetical protein PPL_03837 [Heterostelium album PN500]|uniref:NAD-dependent epimerase/dehydratase domain-containing protein n=1 Tax=Heterostelium pallidum (strain ATCC 26659 / Pp 5 / PN500) TaxID=670386 RepID=D3B6T0_HETP5|nr:hypothetical protein PPL_03837 [Heterostelium album PN500]EFA83050.1 hypothetical protein PPL_03837 [Heterostelium album PN500]|eukprot:XP_020435167.1 hypothetical protein PPL_03837 [Heterostelium album PN500]